MSSNTLLPIKDVLLQSWRNVKGVKGKIWLGYLMTLISGGIIMSLFFLLSLLVPSLPTPSTLFFLPSSGIALTLQQVILISIISIVNYLIIAPLVAWMMMTSIKRTRQEPIGYDTLFNYFNCHDWPRISIALIISILPFLLLNFIHLIMLFHVKVSTTQILLPTVRALSSIIFIVAFIILQLMMMYTVPSLIEKNLSPWQAICQSYQLSKGYRLRIFIIYFVQTLILGLVYGGPLFILVSLTMNLPFPPVLILSLIFIFFGLIWIYPWLWMTYGAIYHRLTQSTRTNIE